MPRRAGRSRTRTDDPRPLGRIVNVASIVGMRANPGQANYAAAKAGLIGLTKTGFAEGVRPELLDYVPARRVGTAEEVAACIRFLASPAASYVTGVTLPVDGG